jgi:hypothetical protein
MSRKKESCSVHLRPVTILLWEPRTFVSSRGRRTDASGHRIPQTVDPNLGPRNVRIHGIGRWSVVYYERQLYRTSPQMPTAPPWAAEYAVLG